jgi:hypothetical protein
VTSPHVGSWPRATTPGSLSTPSGDPQFSDRLCNCGCRIAGLGAHVMAIINNMILGLLLRQGVTNVPDARRYYDAKPEEAVKLLLLAPA